MPAMRCGIVPPQCLGDRAYLAIKALVRRP